MGLGGKGLGVLFKNVFQKFGDLSRKVPGTLCLGVFWSCIVGFGGSFSDRCLFGLTVPRAFWQSLFEAAGSILRTRNSTD